MTKSIAKASRHEPLIRLARRDAVPFWKKMTVRVISVLLALVVAALFLYFVTGLNPKSIKRCSRVRLVPGGRFLSRCAICPRCCA